MKTALSRPILVITTILASLAAIPVHGAAARPLNVVGAPVFIPAGPDAEALAKAFATARAGTRATRGANPPLNAEGDFLIGPDYVNAPELTLPLKPGVAEPTVVQAPRGQRGAPPAPRPELPAGQIYSDEVAAFRRSNAAIPVGHMITFSMSSADSKIYPGISKAANGTLDPNNLYTLLVDSRPTPYTRTVTVYVPAGYVSGTPTPVMVGLDGTGYIQTTVLDNLIAQKRIPAIIGVGITPGNFPQGTNNDAQGSQRGLEYDTMSGKFAEFVETEVFPLVEKNAGVVITKDPEGRAAIGGSSGAACAFTMAWYHPDLFRRIISYSGTFVNQQWPFNPETPHGAWGYHENIIADSEVKPIRIWMQVSDGDLLNPNVMKDNMHDWVAANNRMAMVLRNKGYHYQYSYSLNSGHTTAPARNQTYAEAYEWVWQGYKPTGK
ncbi:MAG: alpha/beta hydrolase-fold protein [Verrucomicrobiota bacterium]